MPASDGSTPGPVPTGAALPPPTLPAFAAGEEAEARAAFREALEAALRPTFALGRELTGGGMSRVFVAEEVALGRTVVVKVLPPDLAAGVNRERFRREIQLAARLQHPHVVPLLSAGEAAGSLYYTMPYIDGDSLRERVQALAARGERMGVREVVRVLHDVVEALAFAHARGVVHRDVKPGNVLMLGAHALVADFGVAKALSAALPHTGATSVGIAIGTPAYMAPEQLAADPAADHRMDLYATGLLAYELLTGASPFAAASPQATLAAQLTRVPAPVHELRPDVPPALSAVLMRCLAKEPAERPATAEALLEDLEAVAAGGLPGGAVTASGEPVPGVAWTPRGGTQPTVAATVPAAAVATTPSAGATVPVAAPGAPPPRRRREALLTTTAVLGLGLGLVGAWALGRSGNGGQPAERRVDPAALVAAPAAAPAAPPAPPPPAVQAPAPGTAAPAAVAAGPTRLTRDDSLAIAAAVERRLVAERRAEERAAALKAGRGSEPAGPSVAEHDARKAHLWKEFADSVAKGAWRDVVKGLPVAGAAARAGAEAGVRVMVPMPPSMPLPPEVLERIEIRRREAGAAAAAPATAAVPARDSVARGRAAEFARLAARVPPPREGARRLLVLDLQDGTGRRDLAGAATGTSAALRRALGRRAGYELVDHAVGAAARGSRLKVRSVADAVGASAAVFGTMHVHADSLWAVVQVLDVRRGYPSAVKVGVPLEAADGPALADRVAGALEGMLDRVAWTGPSNGPASGPPRRPTVELP